MLCLCTYTSQHQDASAVAGPRPSRVQSRNSCSLYVLCCMYAQVSATGQYTAEYHTSTSLNGPIFQGWRISQSPAHSLSYSKLYHMLWWKQGRVLTETTHRDSVSPLSDSHTWVSPLPISKHSPENTVHHTNKKTVLFFIWCNPRRMVWNRTNLTVFRQSKAGAASFFPIFSTVPVLHKPCTLPFRIKKRSKKGI